MIRQATIEDIPEIIRLEEKCWKYHLRASYEVIERRIHNFPQGQYLLVKEETIAGILFTQIVENIESLHNASYSNLSDLHNNNGKFMQLISIAVDVQLVPNGANILREHAKKFAASAENIQKIVAVTRCSRFLEEYNQEGYENYVCTLTDPTIFFHTSGGATILCIIHNYRPEDIDNGGCGVLICYNIKKPAGDWKGRIFQFLSLSFSQCPKEMVSASRTPFMNFLDSLQLMTFHHWLQQQCEEPLPVDLLFRFPTINSLEKFFQKENNLTEDTTTRKMPREEAWKDFAIIGIGIKFPNDVESLADLWNEVIVKGKCVTNDPASTASTLRNQEFSRMRKEAEETRRDHEEHNEDQEDDNNVTRFGGYLSRIDEFDGQFFQLPYAQEIIHLDPNHRLLLECVAKAVYDSNRTLDALDGKDIGVYVGLSNSDFQLLSDSGFRNSQASVYNAVGGANSMASGRISFLLGTTGPSHVVDTACSSSLVAIHQACQAIAMNECSEAIVAASNLILTPWITQSFQQAGMLSPDGACHAFDEAANGYVRSEGVAAIIIKPLSRAIEDNDKVYTIIKGSAVLHHGKSASLTAPNAKVQEELLLKALHNSGKTIEDIDFIEAHGTGTKLGDPIEVTAIANSFVKRTRPLYLSSIKGNLGHLETTAGLAGLCATILSFQTNYVNGNANLHKLNEKLVNIVECHPFLKFPNAVEPLLQSRCERRLVGAVSSFGYSGTIAHVILEQPPIELLKLIPSLASSEKERKIIFQFAGQGKVRKGVFKNFQRNQFLNELIQQCDSLLQPYFAQIEGCPSYKEFCYSQIDAEEQYTDEFYHFIVPLFHVCIEYCYARLLIARGFIPSTLIGHSLGEYTAAVIANCMTLSDAIVLLHQRSGLIKTHGSHCSGQMVLLQGISLQNIQTSIVSEKMEQQIFIAVVNDSKGNVVITGKEDELHSFLNKLQQIAANIQATTLPMKHCYHSPFMSSVAAEFKEFVKTIPLKSPEISILSTLAPYSTNHLDIGSYFASADYWADHLTNRVNYSQTMERLLKESDQTQDILEINPSGYNLTNLTRAFAQDSSFVGEGKLISIHEIENDYFPVDFSSEYSPKCYPYNSSSDQSDPTRVSLVLQEYYEDDCLAEHRIAGEVVLPGAAIIDATAKYLLEHSISLNGKHGTEESAVELTDFMIFRSILPGKNDWHLSLEIDSKNRRISWKDEEHDQVFSELSYTYLTEQSSTGTPRFPLAEQSCTVDMRRFYEIYSARGLYFGASYQLIDKLVILTDGSHVFYQGQLKVPACNFLKAQKRRNCMPQIIDALIHSTGCILYDQTSNSIDDDRLYVPFHIQRILISPSFSNFFREWKMSIGEKLYSFQCEKMNPKPNEQSNQDSYYFNCFLYDGVNNEPILSLEGLQMRRYRRLEDGEKELSLVVSSIDGESETDTLDLPLITDNKPLLSNTLWVSLCPEEIKEPSAFQEIMMLSDHDSLEAIEKRIFSKEFNSLVLLCSEEAEITHSQLESSVKLMMLVGKSSIKRVSLFAINVDSRNQRQGRCECLKGLLYSLRLELFDISFQLISFRIPFEIHSIGGLMTSVLEDSQQTGSLEIHYTLHSISDNRGKVVKSVPSMKVLESSPPVQSAENLWKYELKDGQRGSLDQFQLVPDKIPLYEYLENIVPPEGYALIEVCYIGLNFRDVLNVLGMYPGNPGPPGCEFSGKIIRLNKLNQQPELQEEEFVIGFHTGCFQPFITVPISQIIRLPKAIPLEVGCMLPIIYTTIEYCFQKALSHLHPGDIILIHSGSGGIGLVAIQYAKYYQLTILTTVNKNNKEKYSFLRDEMGIPEEQIFHSRNAEEFHCELSQYFRQDQRKNTSISMVINSLTDDFIPYSMEFLGHSAPGYFMELGKRDRWTTETIRKRFPTQSICYILVEIDELALQSSSSSYKELLSAVIGRFDERQFTAPIHFQVFDYFLGVKEAFLQLKNGQTIGKSVIKLSSPRLIKNLRAFQANGGNYPPASFVITGGTGSLGVVVAHSLLAREDVEKVFLLSRSGEFKSDVHNLASQLPMDKIEIVRVDVSDETAMNAFFSSYFTADKIEKPKYHLRGIFHCAGIVKDSLLPQVSSSASTSHVVSYLQNFHEIWRSKGESARILFEVSQKIHSDANGSPFLVLFSSIVARIGRVGQASYAIANRFLDGMAMENNSVYSIRWPAILDIGMAAQQNGNHVNTNHWHIRSEDVRYFLESLSNEINSPTSSSFSQSRVRNIFPSSIGRILDEQIRNQFPAVIHSIESDQTAKRKKIQLGKKSKGKKQQGNDSSSSLPASLHPVPDKESLRQLVMQLCNDFFPTEILSSLTEASNLIENGLDSLAATEFVHHLTQSVFSVFGSEIKLPGTFLFNYSTIHEVVEKLHEILAPNRDPTIDSAGSTNPANGSKQHGNGSADGVEKEEIAIIAASCVFPGNIFSLDDLHRVQSNGVVVTNHFPSEERMKSFQSTLSSAASFFQSNKKDSLQQTIQFGGFLPDEYLKDFSYKWFDNLPLLEANKLDLRQKLALKITRQCFQESHVEVNDWKGKRVGVYVACLGQLKSSSFSSSQSTGQAKYSVFDATSNSMSVLSGRISFTFGLEGPCMTIDTACSSSLVAIHMARNALQSKECEFAVVVSINLIDLELSIPFGLSGMLSSDGKCHSFDDAANGYVRSEGCAAILLAPLSMASHYPAPPLAIIRASSISHDGKSASLTSPNGLAQEKLLRQAIEQAGLRPDDIDVIEAHGTGTRLGDPIEVEAILKVFQDRTNTQKPLYLSSVKGNLGHLEASAGLAGIFAALNCLKHHKAYPNANLSSINREIDQLLEAHKAKEWLKFPRGLVDLTSTESRRFIGISSFGYSGTIAHCILQQSGKVGQEIAKTHA